VPTEDWPGEWEPGTELERRLPVTVLAFCLLLSSNSWFADVLEGTLSFTSVVMKDDVNARTGIWGAGSDPKMPGAYERPLRVENADHTHW